MVVGGAGGGGMRWSRWMARRWWDAVEQILKTLEIVGKMEPKSIIDDQLRLRGVSMVWMMYVSTKASSISKYAIPWSIDVPGS
ncbi:hypothetical protein R6Q59_015411 [Mikania micrantha]